MTLAELLQDLERRRADAARMNATAPVADVLGAVLEELRPLAHRSRPAATNGARGNQMLSAKDVAQRLGVSSRWVYDHADDLPFAHRVGGRSVRFSARGLEAYLERRRTL